MDINQQPEQKNGDWKNIIAIIFLVIFTPLGLILMWAIADWTKKVKVVITIILLLPILLVVFLMSTITVTSFQGASSRASDSRIISAIAMSRTKMTFLKANEGSLVDFNCQHIEMKELCNEVKGQGSELRVVKNSSGSEACVYAKMQSEENQWYCADNKGGAGWVREDPNNNGYCAEGAESVSCPSAVSNF